MVNISLPDEIAQKIEAVAKLENRPVEDVVASMVERYLPQQFSQEESDIVSSRDTESKKFPSWDSILGIGDENVTDMSMIGKLTDVNPSATLNYLDVLVQELKRPLVSIDGFFNMLPQIESDEHRKNLLARVPVVIGNIMQILDSAEMYVEQRRN